MTRADSLAARASRRTRLGAILCASLAAAWATACTGESVDAAAVAAGRDSAGVQVIEHPPSVLTASTTLRLADRPSVRIGVQAGNPDLQFTSISGGARLPDGRFALLDRDDHTLRIFDARGRFVRRIGGLGSGPGEFRQPSQLAVGADTTLAVWDWAGQRVSWFRPDGTLLRDAALAVSGVSAMASLLRGAVLAVVEESASRDGKPVGGTRRNTGRLVRLEPDGRLVTAATFPATEWTMLVAPSGAMQIQRPWFTRRLLATITPGGAWVTDGTRWEAVRRSAGGTVDRIVRIQAPLERLTDARIREVQAAELDAATTPEARQARERYHRTLKYPATIPPVEALFADAAGRLWVGRNQPPATNLPTGMGRATRQWAVFADEGARALGTLTLPPKRRPLFADRDGVLVVTVDEDDVPYVEWWPFVSR